MSPNIGDRNCPLALFSFYLSDLGISLQELAFIFRWCAKGPLNIVSYSWFILGAVSADTYLCSRTFVSLLLLLLLLVLLWIETRISMTSYCIWRTSYESDLFVWAKIHMWPIVPGIGCRVLNFCAILVFIIIC